MSIRCWIDYSINKFSIVLKYNNSIVSYAPQKQQSITPKYNFSYHYYTDRFIPSEFDFSIFPSTIVLPPAPITKAIMPVAISAV